MDRLDIMFLGNPLLSWLLALAAFLATFVVLRLVLTTLGTRLVGLAARTRTRWDDIAGGALEKTKPSLLLVISLYAGAGVLSHTGGVDSVLKSVAIIALIVQGAIWASEGIRRWATIQREEQLAEHAAVVMTMDVISVAARFVLWTIVGLLTLENMGVHVTALVAGLGVGGVAVALAAQSILGDLFASVAIVLDRPFVLGDFLIVGDYLGAVEEIGLKTTRIRSLSGEQVIFSNTDLLKSRVRNYGRMYERRVVFKVGVTYQTPRDKLETIPTIIRDAIEAHGERVRFDRSHLQSYGDFAILFETVFYVTGPDYNTYMDIQQAIYLAMHERFEDEGIEFAYPTQTLFVEESPSPPRPRPQA